MRKILEHFIINVDLFMPSLLSTSLIYFIANPLDKHKYHLLYSPCDRLYCCMMSDDSDKAGYLWA